MDPIALNAAVERERMRTNALDAALRNAIRQALPKLIKKATRVSQRGGGFDAWVPLPYSVRDMLWSFDAQEKAVEFGYSVLINEMHVTTPVRLYLHRPRNDSLTGIPMRASLNISLQRS